MARRAQARGPRSERNYLLTMAGASSREPPAAVASTGCRIAGASQMKAVIGALILSAIPLSGFFIVTGRNSGAVSAHADLRIQTVHGSTDVEARPPIKWERVKILPARAGEYSELNLFTGPQISSAILP
jgi:hypothetical protein